MRVRKVSVKTRVWKFNLISFPRSHYYTTAIQGLCGRLIWG